MTVLVAAAQGAEPATRQLALPAVGYGLVVLTCLMALLFVTWAFRSVGTRH